MTLYKQAVAIRDKCGVIARELRPDITFKRSREEIAFDMALLQSMAHTLSEQILKEVKE